MKFNNVIRMLRQQSNKSNLELDRCPAGAAASAGANQRFSVTPTAEVDQKESVPLSTSLSKILRETQFEEKKKEKQQNKDRRVSVDEAQVYFGLHFPIKVTLN